uniref:Transmembrane protein n=1 Tax=Megaselia scalaris TaxID=36166 RepID=T1GJF7_MEGSC
MGCCYNKFAVKNRTSTSARNTIGSLEPTGIILLISEGFGVVAFVVVNISVVEGTGDGVGEVVVFIVVEDSGHGVVVSVGGSVVVDVLVVVGGGVVVFSVVVEVYRDLAVNSQ